ncbi:MAG: hypothetical protein LBI79_10800 [Nitrososphaerota archaeon]|nr:hypothetical protein [Nitrososphaerota archaeon]
MGKPFRFLIVNSKDRGVVGRVLVRFYFQFYDEQVKVQVSNVIRALLDVEVVSVDFPVLGPFGVCLDLELAKHYALPIVNPQQELPVNLVDELVASFAGAEGCLEITAGADPNAAGGVQKFVYEKTSHNPRLGNALFDYGMDFLGEAVGINPKDTPTKKPAQTKVDSWTRECIRNAEKKLYSNLFTCQIHVFSDSQINASGVKSVLPAAMNHFKTFKTTKKQTLQTKLKTPSRHQVRNNILCNLWWAVPLYFLLIVGVLGWFKPLNFITTLYMADLVPPVLAVIFAVCLFVAFKKRHPIVLSTFELSQMMGLPSAIEKLPVALGKVPISRMQLGTQQTADEQNQAFYHLHAFLDEDDTVET